VGPRTSQQDTKKIKFLLLAELELRSHGVQPVAALSIALFRLLGQMCERKIIHSVTRQVLKAMRVKIIVFLFMAELGNLG
jgi:uncharacterized membrane protein